MIPLCAFMIQKKLGVKSALARQISFPFYSGSTVIFIDKSY